MATYQSALKQAEKLSRANHLEASAAKLLLLHFSKLEPTELYLKFTEEMPEETRLEFEKGLHSYVYDGLPVQYILGYVYFYGYKFLVDKNVLIPRFETEELVANVLIEYDRLFDGKPVKIVDIGTGSGCLAIALKLEEQKFEMYASDISLEALSVAKKNALSLNTQVTFIDGDMLKPFAGMKFDIIVSNPPYIPVSEEVAKIISNNEPHIALYGGDNGLKFYEEILKNAKSILNEKSMIAFEHGFDKANELTVMAKTYFPDAQVFTIKDMQGKDRMTFIINN
ncbi:MAG: peptide chain release factor N(5)-glutamine methyltransferase [Candidatus Izemoplasmatales bacterium]|jgi:release factor glutamine methyltransferase|nr:peptide chain release factor N(5)-glutamine methyltransferase [Candidatus Izemoplasmatales bacterium]